MKKNLFQKIIAVFKKPVPTMTIQEIATALKQLTRYHEERLDIIIKMSDTNCLTEIGDLYVKKLMIQERISVLKLKLLKSCDCKAEHIEYIENEQRLKNLYSKKLLEFIHSDGKYY